LAYFSSYSVGEFYDSFFHIGGYVDMTVLIGLPLAYIFFLIFIFTIFGDKNKYLWILFGLLPAALFEIYFERLHIYFPILIGLVGWGLGAGLNWVITKKFAKASKF